MSPAVCFVVLALLVPRISVAREATLQFRLEVSRAPQYASRTATTIRSAIKSGRLDDLRWPDFSRYRTQVEKLYRSAGYSLVWIQGSELTERARGLIEALLEADKEGLNPDDYDGPRWHGRLLHLEGSHTVEDEARFDLALTVCAMRYISDVRIGRINPSQLRFGTVMDGRRLDLADYLDHLLSSTTSLSSELAKVEPQSADYHATRQALLKYLELAKQPDGEILPAPIGIVFRRGYYDHFFALARRLRLLGDLPRDAVVSDRMLYYDGALRKAVRHFQRRHGLIATGDLTSDTIDRLNVPLRTRVQQLGLALERCRWPHSGDRQPSIVINLPELRLNAYDESGNNVLSIGIDVGDAYYFPTPVFESSIRYVVFRPYWYVTPEILRDEIIPNIERERDYLSDNEMEVVTHGGKLIATGAIGNAVLAQLRSGSLTVRQKPGPNNALGLLKFVLPNHYQVFLHDKPERKKKFPSPEAAGSHGCIHLDNPAELAEWLLRSQPGWNLRGIYQAMRDGPDNRVVKLSRPATIRITYRTAIAYPNGDVYFYDDIYGQDASLAKALATGFSSPRQHPDLLRSENPGSP
jgi:murein L,D-transpeptidase YcbB/YkuD